MERLDPFATPIFVFDEAALGPELAVTRAELFTRLVAEREVEPGLVRSNVGGWHSAPDLSKRADGCYQQLMRAVVAGVGEAMGALGPQPRFRYGLQAWAMVMRRGDYTTLHDHGDAHWSAVYFVDAGDDGTPPSGVLAFVDPRRGGRSMPKLESGSTFELHARTGTLVVFPGWLQHFVHAYTGDRPRVTISVNVVLEPSG